MGRKKGKDGKNSIKVTRAQVIETLWARGELKWKLRPEQVEIYNIIRGWVGLKGTVYCTRRIGKSFICYLMANEDCHKHEKWEVGFLAPTQKMLHRIFRPIHNILYEDCPSYLRPKWDRDLGGYVFSTGSQLLMSGTDDKRYEDLRGGNAHRLYYDEPGSMTDLDVIVYSIAQPQTLTTRKERGDSVAQVFLGTPAPTPAHPYFFIKEQCKSEGQYVKKTIYDNSSLDEYTIEIYKKETQEDANSSWEREYLCEDVVDKENAIIPEFTEQKERELVREAPRPEYFVLYGAMDPGFSAYTAYVLGYYDFLNANFVIEGEYWENSKNTAEIAKAVSKLENELFPNNRVYIRFSDTDPRLIADLSILHSLQFTKTRKDNKDVQVNYVRNMVGASRLIIHPRCKNLIRQMRIGVWNDQKTKFASTNLEGHFDLLDALVYFMRNVDIHENPYPHEYDSYSRDTHYITPYRQQQRNHVKLHDALIRI